MFKLEATKKFTDIKSNQLLDYIYLYHFGVID